jgi:hypothetical protein
LAKVVVLSQFLAARGDVCEALKILCGHPWTFVEQSEFPNPFEFLNRLYQ